MSSRELIDSSKMGLGSVRTKKFISEGSCVEIGKKLLKVSSKTSWEAQTASRKEEKKKRGEKKAWKLRSR